METNLKSEVLEDLKSAMKEKNTSKLEAVRATKSAIDKFEKENPGQPINYVKALKPLIKQRVDSIEQFKLAGNTELAGKEELELLVINNYLDKVQPKQMSLDETKEILMKYVAENSFNKNDMGKIMSFFKTNFEGQYDAKELSSMIKDVLS